MKVICKVCMEVVGETGFNPYEEAFIVCADCKKKEVPHDGR